MGDVIEFSEWDAWPYVTSVNQSYRSVYCGRMARGIDGISVNAPKSNPLKIFFHVRRKSYQEELDLIKTVERFMKQRSKVNELR